MISFKIREKDGTVWTVYDEEAVYGHIYHLTKDEMLAIEVSSWTEVASIEERYEAEDFSVEVVDES